MVVEQDETERETAPPAAAATTTSPLSPLSPGQADVRHARGVSWDLALQAAAARGHAAHDDGVSAVTQPAVSLKDLVGVAPMESEAETLLMHAIEESQPPDVKVETHALNTLTPQEESLFSRPSVDGTTTSQATSTRILPPSSKKSLFSKSAQQDTTKHLWDLARHLKQQQKSGHTSMHSNSSDDEHLPASGGGQSDLLAVHAAKLLSQRKKQASSKGTQDQVRESTTTAKWSKLRAAVQMNVAVQAAVNDKKKQDDNDIEQGTSTRSGLHAPSHDDEAEEALASTEEEADANLTSSMNNSLTASGAKKEFTKEKGVYAEFHAFRQWASFKKTSLLGYIRKALMFAILPSTGIAALLFYVGDNPPCGTQVECLRAEVRANILGNVTEAVEERGIDNLLGPRGVRYDSPSVAWWILFIGVRQVITLSLARLLEAIVIDFWVLKTRSASRILGPYLSLLIVQAKGWPIQFIFWGLLDIGMLYGDRPFARHWLYWQEVIDLFNNTNPGGDVTESTKYKALLSLMCAIGGVVAFKRFFVGLRLGIKTYKRYGADLAKIMKKTILVSEVAALASEIQKHELYTEDFGLHTEIYNEAEEDGSKAGSTTAQSNKSIMANLTTIAELASEHKIRIAELLGEWEEPELANQEEESVDIASVIQFRKSLSYLDTQFPFSVTFGPAQTREACVRSAETVYKQLKRATPNSKHVVFDTLALSSIQRDGTLDDHKLRELIKVFRPDREGNLTLLDFCKSVDAVYKELRLFRASVANAARVDRSFEKIINVVFYFILGCISLAILGIDPFALFAAISGFILGFAFMIGAACSKSFEGLLMILITKPYDIGDKIQVAPVTTDSSGTGSAYWLVKDVGLYHTTYMFWTQETATCSNGALASTRIINATRSPQAVMITMFKFPIDTPYHKIEVFKNTLEKFVKNRPREWLSFLAFRPTRVEADAGFVEYVFVAQHRENWANVGALKNSLADVSYFALEVSKKMEMRYTAPPMPINLNMINGNVGAISTPSLQQQMTAQIASQSDRLQQPDLSASLGVGGSAEEQVPFLSRRGPSLRDASVPSQDEEYNFSDIEAMFQKDK